MRNLLFVLIVSALFFTTNTNNLVLAEEQAKPAEVKPTAEAKSAPAEKKVEPTCPCLKPATDAVEASYSSVEEDEWEKIIKTCKDSVTAIKTLSKTCKCPEVAEYQKIVEAFQKYAEGGSHLDGTEEPDCPFALKLYADTIKSLNESIPKISDEKVKEYATNVKDYAQEEEEFVKSECTKSEK